MQWMHRYCDQPLLVGSAAAEAALAEGAHAEHGTHASTSTSQQVKMDEQHQTQAVDDHWSVQSPAQQEVLVESAAAEAAPAEGALAERGTYASTWGIDPSSTPSVHSQTTAFRGHSFRARNSAAIVAAKMRYAAVIPCTMPQTGT
jgi:hypothetical protein